MDGGLSDDESNVLVKDLTRQHRILPCRVVADIVTGTGSQLAKQKKLTPRNSLQQDGSQGTREQPRVVPEKLPNGNYA